MSGIFINYRREDSAPYAGRLFDHLEREFGRSKVFMDIDSIELGVDFVEALKTTLARCDAQIVMIGPGWLQAKDDNGRRRLDNPKDYVRLEILTALERGIRLIPVLVAGASMPAERELPRRLAKLSTRNALDLSDKGFLRDVAKLIETLDPIVHPRAKPSSASTTKKASRPPQATKTSPPHGGSQPLPRPLREAFAQLPLRHQLALRWFADHSGQDVHWPESIHTPDGETLLATRAKGIYKPAWSQYALSVRQSLSGPYKDLKPVVRPDGTWLFKYFQENTTPTERDQEYTNRALLSCQRDRVPVGVMRQTKGPSGLRYSVLGLAFVTGWKDGYFLLEGFAPPASV